MGTAKVSAARILPIALLALAGLAGLAPGIMAVPAGEVVASALVEPALPDTKPGRCAKAFIAMVNDGSPAAVRAFESAWASKQRLETASVEDRVGRIADLHEQWRSITVKEVLASNDTTISLAVELGSGDGAQLDFKFSDAEAGKIDGVMIAIGSESVRPQALTAEARTSTVEGIARALREGYVFPEKAEEMAQSILTKLKAGEYDAVENEAALASTLTEDLRAITHDMHLGVRLAPKEAETAARPGGMLHNDADQARRENYAFRKVEVLAGNIGYVRLDAFLESEGAKEAAAAAMAFLANCDAVIFDLRSNGGGSPEMIRFITSYLFDEPTHLNDMIDRQGSVVEEYWTLKDVPGKRFAADLPVFVLTSKRTFSGAEEFSYNLKNLRRGTIIGETTGGGAHPVRTERVNDRFIIGVPFMRANNPISKTNWEGTGVEPDIKTTAGEALERAVKEAGAAIKGRAGKK